MFPSWKDKLRKFQVSLTWDKLDDVLLPRSGFRINGLYEGSFKKLKSDLEYSYIWTSANIYSTFLQKHTLRFFGFWGTSRSAPIYKFLNLGRPEFFIGMDYDQLYGSQISILRCDYRYQFKKDIFFKLIANVAYNLEYHLPHINVKPYNLSGFGAAVKLLSPVGPLEVIFSRGDKVFVGPRKKQNLVYFILGYKF